MSELTKAIYELKDKLPGWWFTLGECSVSCDATVGPDVAYCPKWMLEAFDGGVVVDLLQPSTLEEALRACTDSALALLDEYERGEVRKPENRE